MANVQEQFEEFHSQIRTYYEINETLREKKEIIVSRITNHLIAMKRPGFDVFLQGSYKMKVGICPLPGMEFDIDVGLRFSIRPTDYSATQVRAWVVEAIGDHTDEVTEKGPCIRVNYERGFHVDLVCYAWFDDANGDERHELAHKTLGWRPSDPPRLVQHVLDLRQPFANTEDGTQTDQFRRVVRYLKRWNDIALPFESNDKPSGLALVLLCGDLLRSPSQRWDGESNDLDALIRVARTAGNSSGRIVAIKPTPEGEDMFGRLSDAAMDSLKRRFQRLATSLEQATNHPEVHIACDLLARQLGDDFPIPSAAREARRSTAPAVITSSSSA